MLCVGAGDVQGDNEGGVESGSGAETTSKVGCIVA